MKAMKDYYNLCLECDALLLTDVFKKTFYLVAMLNMTKIEFELISDAGM